MRKYTTVCIDNKTDMQIIYSECTLNEVGYQLEVADEMKVYDCIYHNKDGVNNLIEIITRTQTFYYDEERQLLLKPNLFINGERIIL